MKFQVGKDINEPRAMALSTLQSATHLRHAEHAPYPHVYEAKVKEALTGQFDILREEAALRGVAPEQLAEQVLSRRQESMDRIRQIEMERVICKQQILAATKREQVYAAINVYLDQCQAEGLNVFVLRQQVRPNDISR